MNTSRTCLALTAAVGLSLFGDEASAFPIDGSAATPQEAVIRVLCKYGTPHCANPNPGPKLPQVGGAQLPPDGWQDPDCKYYGNWNSGSPGAWGDPSISRKTTTGTRPALSGTIRTMPMGSAKR